MYQLLDTILCFFFFTPLVRSQGDSSTSPSSIFFPPNVFCIFFVLLEHHHVFFFVFFSLSSFSLSSFLLGALKTHILRHVPSFSSPLLFCVPQPTPTLFFVCFFTLFLSSPRCLLTYLVSLPSVQPCKYFFFNKRRKP